MPIGTPGNNGFGWGPQGKYSPDGFPATSYFFATILLDACAADGHGLYLQGKSREWSWNDVLQALVAEIPVAGDLAVLAGEVIKRAGQPFGERIVELNRDGGFRGVVLYVEWWDAGRGGPNSVDDFEAPDVYSQPDFFAPGSPYNPCEGGEFHLITSVGC